MGLKLKYRECKYRSDRAYSTWDRMRSYLFSVIIGSMLDLNEFADADADADAATDANAHLSTHSTAEKSAHAACSILQSNLSIQSDSYSTLSTICTMSHPSLPRSL